MTSRPRSPARSPGAGTLASTGPGAGRAPRTPRGTANTAGTSGGFGELGIDRPRHRPHQFHGHPAALAEEPGQAVGPLAAIHRQVAETAALSVLAVRRFAAFLASPAVNRGPAGAGRPAPAGALPGHYAELAGRTVHRHMIGQLNLFFTAIRQHGWDSTLPTNTMFFPEDLPEEPQWLPRALSEHVMAQLERPDNLSRWNIPAYQLVTVILMRCGLRVTDALGLPGDCIVRDVNGAPYLRYYNHKMKREALVPVDFGRTVNLAGRAADRRRARRRDQAPLSGASLPGRPGSPPQHPSARSQPAAAGDPQRPHVLGGHHPRTAHPHGTPPRRRNRPQNPADGPAEPRTADHSTHARSQAGPTEEPRIDASCLPGRCHTRRQCLKLGASGYRPAHRSRCQALRSCRKRRPPRRALLPGRHARLLIHKSAPCQHRADRLTCGRDVRGSHRSRQDFGDVPVGRAGDGFRRGCLGPEVAAHELRPGLFVSEDGG